MAGKNRYQMAKELVEELHKRFKQISMDTLKNEIRMKLGSDEKRTVLPYLKLITDTRLLKETDKGFLFPKVKK